MEDDEQIHSQSNGRITVTIAAPPPHTSPPPPPQQQQHETLTLALPIQQPKNNAREDCWTQSATEVLIDAWGQNYLELSRGNLKQKHWKDVAEIVNSRSDCIRNPKTDVQCKNRIDTVKKKYKTEKAKIQSGGGVSNWLFYDKIDELIGPTAKINSTSPPVPMGIPVGLRSASASASQQRFRLQSEMQFGKRPIVNSDNDDDETEPEDSGDSSDGLPPQSYKRPKFMGNKVSGENGVKIKGSDPMRELTRAIVRFGEMYEQAETAKLKQLVDMEKARMKFAKDMELQRMQFFVNTQSKLSQLKRRRGTDGNRRRREVSNNNPTNNGNNTNSDSSN